MSGKLTAYSRTTTTHCRIAVTLCRSCLSRD